MDPYEADPAKIPSSDRYIQEPTFGRYLPQSDDFKPDERYINSDTPEAIKYWQSVLSQCNESYRIYENETGGRDVFAFGSVIIKSSHLKQTMERDYALADANEMAAIMLAKPVLGDIRVPRIYFANKLDGRALLVQERIPGVALCVAWQYLSAEDKKSFKEQARDILRKLETIKQPPDAKPGPTYVVPADPIKSRGIQTLERDILFPTAAIASQEKGADYSFIHNDLSQSNLIVDKGKITAVVDWEMAGFFGWDKAANVHVSIRSPRRENFAALNLSESFLQDILFWNDLYDCQH